ncbi:MAG: transposase [Acidobacteriota bacterium]|nr:transposase [Acidobacteriota bacterium]MDQ2843417.1 transposase [Acidobacteriota bacterium]
MERYQQVVELHKSGHSQGAIGQTVGISRKTVRRRLRSKDFPERKPPSGRRSHVSEFNEYLRQLWDRGCHNATQLFREICPRGYRGSRQMVSYHVARWRADTKSPKPKAPKRFAPKDIAIMMCKRPERRSAAQQEVLGRLTASHPHIRYLPTLALDFRDALHGKDGQRIRTWVNHSARCADAPIARFAHGLRRDLHAVIAAIETPWSSGQVEGQINRLKALKCQMYGRAGFALLRARVLPYSALGP